jgi:hypothetical protein
MGFAAVKIVYTGPLKVVAPTDYGPARAGAHAGEQALEGWSEEVL